MTPDAVKEAVKVLEQVEAGRKRLADIRAARPLASFVRVEIHGKGNSWGEAKLLDFASARHEYGKAPAGSMVVQLLDAHEKLITDHLRSLGRKLAQLGVSCPPDIAPGGTP